jgi:predicted phosphodiesterase
MKTQNQQRILVVGDIHGRWAVLNELIATQKPDLILQAGDLGYFPRQKKYHPHHIRNGTTIIRFVDGNHEDHDSLAKIKRNEVRPGIFYQKGGSTITLEDGRVVLFMGGASSTDRELRTPEYDWFPQETIRQRDLDNLPDIKVDIVISHTCPREFEILGTGWHPGNDPSMVALSEILEMYHPDLWYFGHWHLYRQGEYRNCRWTCLDECMAVHWWTELA